MEKDQIKKTKAFAVLGIGSSTLLANIKKSSIPGSQIEKRLRKRGKGLLRIGLLDKPPASSAFLLSRASSRTRASLCSSHPNAGMMQYECGHTQLLLCMRRDQGETSGQNLKGYDNTLIIIMIYTIHNHYYNNHS
jgi:hypothetical protein